MEDACWVGVMVKRNYFGRCEEVTPRQAGGEEVGGWPGAGQLQSSSRNLDDTNEGGDRRQEHLAITIDGRLDTKKLGLGSDQWLWKGGRIGWKMKMSGWAGRRRGEWERRWALGLICGGDGWEADSCRRS